jgi:hypothetical protein
MGTIQCDAKAHYGQCRQVGKHEHQGYMFCSAHFTRLKKKNYVKVMGRRGFVVWKDEEAK